MKSIVIIDDDSAVLEIYQMALEAEGYAVFTAQNGDDGLALARQKLPDLILSDIHMPGADGRSVLRSVRADPSLATKQVVLMTGNPRDASPRDGMELGADDFLIKPFGMDELARCVAARLERAKVNWRVEDRVIADLRANLHNVLPHEFFTPLAGILGLSQILRHDIQSMDPSAVQEVLGEIEQSAWRLQRTLRNYLLIVDPQPAAEGLSGPLEPDAVQNIIERAADAIGRRHGRLNDLTLVVKAAALPIAAGDLQIIVEELLDNAFSYSRHGTPVAVHLDPTGELTVSDQGRGMTDAQIAEVGVFRQFDRKKYEQQGLGVGLSLVTRLAAACGARLFLSGGPNQGTVAQIAFPTP